MLQMDAAKVYAFDLDQTIHKKIPHLLKEFEGRYDLREANVLDMPYENDYFDFTHCGGVLHHTHDVFKGIEELLRVTKKGGMLCLVLYGKGGLVRDITTLLRERYRSDDSFKKQIDTLNKAKIHAFFEWLIDSMNEAGDKVDKEPFMKHIAKFFDDDLVLTIHDRILAPVYHETSEEELTRFLKNRGVKEITRLSRYPRYKNMRRFLSPMYNDYKSEFSQLFYGDGAVQIKVIK